MGPRTKYMEYMESTIGEGHGYEPKNLPTQAKIREFLDQGVDINQYFKDPQGWKNNSHWLRQYEASTLLYALVRKNRLFRGKRYDSAIELIKFALNNGADPNIGRTMIDEKGRPVKTSPVKTPLSFAVENRYPVIINLLVSKGAKVSALNIQTWKEYLLEARNPTELTKLQVTMKVLDPTYIVGQEFPARPVPHNAQNAISYADIEDGDIMVNINEEYLGNPGVVGDHSRFYKKNSWEAWEAAHTRLQREGWERYGTEPKPLHSPYSQLPITSKVIYRAEKMPEPAEAKKEEAPASAPTNTTPANKPANAPTNTATATANKPANKKNNNGACNEATGECTIMGGKRRTRKQKRRGRKTRRV